ncbi:hypothetical protein C8R45DRAFT_1006887 [Mycena sanguinolenta]|nr:hypothetical protein C8R45DRAFT_1006887 [Mycena sanguinolenta]
MPVPALRPPQSSPTRRAAPGTSRLAAPTKNSDSNVPSALLEAWGTTAGGPCILRLHLHSDTSRHCSRLSPLDIRSLPRARVLRSYHASRGLLRHRSSLGIAGVASSEDAHRVSLPSALCVLRVLPSASHITTTISTLPDALPIVGRGARRRRRRRYRARPGRDKATGVFSEPLPLQHSQLQTDMDGLKFSLDLGSDRPRTSPRRAFASSFLERMLPTQSILLTTVAPMDPLLLHHRTDGWSTLLCWQILSRTLRFVVHLPPITDK